jgi:flagellar biosynthesis chaperone FliJ
MDMEQYRQDFVRGGLGSDELRERLLAVLDVAEQGQQAILKQQQTIAGLERRVEELEAELGRKPTARLDEEYSLQSEEQREARKSSKPRKQKECDCPSGCLRW